MKALQRAFYLPAEGGDCFCMYRCPDHDAVLGTILHLAAFGDEMNKARAMTARTARALASRGFGVLQIDFFGCGDSAGEHADATLARWTGNAMRAIDWLRTQPSKRDILWLWALRAGALLIPPLLARAAPDAPLLLWQPVLSGAQQLNHLLRQKLAEGLIDTSAERSGTRTLRQRLRDGATLETGGYGISPALADELDRATFCMPDNYRGRIAWLEVVSSAAPSLSPAARKNIDGLRSAGIDIAAKAVQGPGFWQSVETEHCDALVDASLSALTMGETSELPRHPAVL